jgi:pyruvate-formate lyase
VIAMSNVSKIPPKFSSEKNYALWKKELEAWTCITSHAKKDWGKIIALNLPENDPSNIREKAFSVNLEATNENEKQGFDNLLKFMDDEFKKDSITDMCEHIRKFMKLEKKEEERMKVYVSNFEAAYQVAKEKGLPELPHAYRMYQLLENAKITDHEYMMVLTGISSDSTDLYNDAKKSLLKLFNSSRSQGVQNEHNTIKHEPNSETFWGHRSEN